MALRLSNRNPANGLRVASPASVTPVSVRFRAFSSGRSVRYLRSASRNLDLETSRTARRVIPPMARNRSAGMLASKR